MLKSTFYFSIIPKTSLNNSPFDVDTVEVIQIALDFNQIIYRVAAWQSLLFP